MQDKPMSILEHLDALRRVLVVSFISIIPGSVIGWFVREDVLHILVRPVNQMGYHLVYIGTTEAFTAELKIAIIAGVVFASPIIAYQFWRFLLPALHAHEKRYLLTFVPVSLLLFAIGVSFAYFIVFSYAIKFFLSFSGEGLLQPMLTLSKYLSFTIWLLVPFGLIFELPLLVVLLARLGLISPEFLARYRKWAFLAVFIFAAIITPTVDMFTQTAMGLAMYLLYEVSIWLSYLIRRKKKAQVATAGGEGPGVDSTGQDAAISAEPDIVDSTGDKVGKAGADNGSGPEADDITREGNPPSPDLNNGPNEAGNAAEDAAGNVAGDAARDTTGDTAGDTAEDTAGDTAEDTAGETAENAAGDTAGDTTKDAAGDAAQNAAENTAENTAEGRAEQVSEDTLPGTGEKQDLAEIYRKIIERGRKDDQ